jgi:UDP-glucuronate 4-epimerase
MLELARRESVPKFVLASSSSVYGENPDLPWREDTVTLKPISPYAASKISAEMVGHVYSHLHRIRVVALRFFTVYGPRQRPDLAIHKFARNIGDGTPITLYGDGSTRRDYTFVSDIISGIAAALGYDATPFEVINLGNGSPVSLLEMVNALEEVMGIKATREFTPTQPGDVTETWADTSKAARLLGYRPAVSFREGLRAFLEWLKAERE